MAFSQFMPDGGRPVDTMGPSATSSEATKVVFPLADVSFLGLSQDDFCVDWQVDDEPKVAG